MAELVSVLNHQRSGEAMTIVVTRGEVEIRLF